MSRLDELVKMRDFLNAEIAAEQDRLGSLNKDVGQLITTAADLYGVEFHAILSGSRMAQVIRARQAACWLLRNRAGLSFPRIGQALGCDHTTVMHSCRKIDADVAVRALLAPLGATTRNQEAS